jgi:hypothetical protein
MNTTLHKLNNEISPAFCRSPPGCEYVTEKMWNISQIKPIEMVMISTDEQAYVKLHRYLGQ